MAWGIRTSSISLLQVRKDPESHVALLNYISLLLPEWDEDWHKVVFSKTKCIAPSVTDQPEYTRL
jgi:hypothetical protein